MEMDRKTSYSIGIPEIDAQHRQLFECIDRLEAAGDDRQRELAVYYVMDELRDYVRIHFSVEEVVMRLFDYPELEKHAAEHRLFASRLESFEQTELKHDVHSEAADFLREWLVNHIQGSDQRYADFLLSAGLPTSATPAP
jgi:hemerythrin